MGNVVNTCPNKSILISKVNLQNPSQSCIQCLSGQFLNSSTSLCQDCPIGTYCPTNGLTNPVNCPSGFSCTKTALKSYEFCPDNNQCSDPSINQLCTTGTYRQNLFIFLNETITSMHYLQPTNPTNIVFDATKSIPMSTFFWCIKNNEKTKLWIALSRQKWSTIYKSVDGITWTSSVVESGLGSCNSICTNENIWVIGADISVNTISYSLDNGNTWRGLNIFTSSCNMVKYANNIWVAVGNSTNGCIAYSSNAINWTKVTTVIDYCHDVCFGNNTWIATCYFATYYIYISRNNGITWTTVSAFGSNTPSRVDFGNNRFILTVVNRDFFYISDDNGYTWNQKTFNLLELNRSAVLIKYFSKLNMWYIPTNNSTNSYLLSFDNGNNFTKYLSGTIKLRDAECLILDGVSCKPIPCNVSNYTGTDGSCVCATGYTGTVTYTSGILGGCVIKTEYTLSIPQTVSINTSGTYQVSFILSNIAKTITNFTLKFQGQFLTNIIEFSKVSFGSNPSKFFSPSSIMSSTTTTTIGFGRFTTTLIANDKLNLFFYVFKTLSSDFKIGFDTMNLN